jgi:hypothetical protein
MDTQPADDQFFVNGHTLTIPWDIRVGTSVDLSTGKHMIVMDNVAIIEVDREHVGLALEMVYATLRRIRDYDQSNNPVYPVRALFEQPQV